MLPEFQLTGKVALVTGAGGLLGREHCRALADAGAQVVAADVDSAAAEKVAADLGTTVRAARLDVTSHASAMTLLDEILATEGRLDVVVNNAAINDKFEDPRQAAELSRFESYPMEQWRRSVDVNLTGVFVCCQVFGSHLAGTDGGSIINIASTYGMVGPDQSIYRAGTEEQTFFKPPAYSATKGGVIALTRFLAAYWGRSGVRVNTLSPGGVEADQDGWFMGNYAARTPLGRMAAPTDYRGAIVFLASDASAYMTGANLVVDGGWTAW